MNMKHSWSFTYYCAKSCHHQKSQLSPFAYPSLAFAVPVFYITMKICYSRDPVSFSLNSILSPHTYSLSLQFPSQSPLLSISNPPTFLPLRSVLTNLTPSYIFLAALTIRFCGLLSLPRTLLPILCPAVLASVSCFFMARISQFGLMDQRIENQYCNTQTARVHLAAWDWTNTETLIASLAAPLRHLIPDGFAS